MTAPDELLTGEDVDAFALSNPNSVTTDVRARAMRDPRPTTPAHEAINEAFGKRAS